MTALRCRRRPVASDAVLLRQVAGLNPSMRRLLKLRSLRSIAVLKNSVNSVVVKWPDMAVRKASELSAELSGLALLVNTSARSSGLSSSTAGGDSGSELADVSCSVTKRPDVSESTDAF